MSETNNSGAHNSIQLRVEQLEDRMMLSVVSIFAAGDTGEENLIVIVNDVEVATFENVGGDASSRQFETLTFESDEPLTGDDIRIEFRNDLFDPANGIDRNLTVDRIEIDGFVYQTESPSTYSTGVWRDGGLTGPGLLETEQLNVNGSFLYSDESAMLTQFGTRIRVDAIGSTGDEILEIRIDGRAVTSFEVSTESEAYFYVAPIPVSADRVQIAFTNDLFDEANGVDRNLTVSSYQVIDRASGARTIVNPSSNNVFSTGTWLPDSGVVDGFGRGNVLHANGFFQVGGSQNFGSLSFDGQGGRLTSPSAGSFTFTVFRTAGDGDVSFDWVAEGLAADRSAFPFRESTGTVFIPAGEQVTEFTVFFADTETTGFFNVSLVNPTGGLSITDGSSRTRVEVRELV